jgi:hypothetical protein
MPGMRLSVPQATRLCGIDSGSCQTAMAELVREHLLSRSDDGNYSLCYSEGSRGVRHDSSATSNSPSEWLDARNRPRR